METNAMFEEMTCEEFYVNDADHAAWLDSLETDWVNGILDEIAQDIRDEEISATIYA